MKEIQIKFKRSKIAFRIFYSFGFLLVGIWLLYGNTEILNYFPKFSSSSLKRFMGFFCLMSFLISLIFLIWCATTSTFALTIDDQSIEDRTSFFPKIIYRNNIVSIEPSFLAFFGIRMKVIKIVTTDSEKPKYLSPNLIDISFDELLNLLVSK